MNFYEKVIRYYMEISSSMNVRMGNDKHKSSIHISGKINKSLMVIYMVFTLVVILISILFLFIPADGNIIFFLYNLWSKKRSHGSLIGLTFLAVLFAIGIVTIKSKLTFKRLERHTTNINIYQRELPTKLRPAHVRMLLNDGLIDDKTLASTVIDLIDRGYLKLRREQGEEYSKLDIFKKGDIVLCRTEKSDEELLSFEKYVINWFIKKCGDGKEVTSEQLNKKIKNSKNFNLGAESFHEFKAHTMLSFPINVFFDKAKEYEEKNKKYLIFMIIGFFPIIPIISPFLFAYGFGCLSFVLPRKFLNQAGVDEKDSWEDLKKYLVDFGDMESKTPEMVTLWNFYLTYSIALGIDGIAGEEIADFFGENIYFSNNNSPGSFINVSVEVMPSNIGNNKDKEQIIKMAEEEKNKYDYYK